MNLSSLNDFFNINIFTSLLVVLISFIVGVLTIFLGLKILAVLGIMVFLILFFVKFEYVFLVLLIIRNSTEMLYMVKIGNMAITQLMWGSISILFLYYFIFNQYNFLEIKVNRIYLLFLILGAFPMFFSKDILQDFGYWLKLLQGFIFFNATILIIREKFHYDKNKINMIFWASILSIAIPLLLYMKNFATGVSTMMGGYERYSTFYSYENAFSYLIFIIFPIFIFFYKVKVENYKKIAYVAVIFFMLFVIYTTKTRNIWMGVAFFIFFWFFKQKKYLFLAFSFIMTLIIILLNPLVQDRLKDIYILITKYENFWKLNPRLFSSRIGIWQTNLKYFIYESSIFEKFFGSGFGKGEELTTKYLSNNMPEHNNYLTMLMGIGIVGLISYLILLFRQLHEIRILLKSKNAYWFNFAQIYFSFFMAYLIIGFITHIIWNLTFQMFFSVFLGMITAVNMSDNKDIKVEK